MSDGAPGRHRYPSDARWRATRCALIHYSIVPHIKRWRGPRTEALHRLAQLSPSELSDNEWLVQQRRRPVSPHVIKLAQGKLLKALDAPEESAQTPEIERNNRHIDRRVIAFNARTLSPRERCTFAEKAHGLLAEKGHARKINDVPRFFHEETESRMAWHCVKPRQVKLFHAHRALFDAARPLTDNTSFIKRRPAGLHSITSTVHIMRDTRAFRSSADGAGGNDSTCVRYPVPFPRRRSNKSERRKSTGRLLRNAAASLNANPAGPAPSRAHENWPHRCSARAGVATPRRIAAHARETEKRDGRPARKLPSLTIGFPASW